MIIRLTTMMAIQARRFRSHLETGFSTSSINPPWTQPIASMATVGGLEFDISAPGTLTMLSG
jgi:hypothetical protein